MTDLPHHDRGGTPPPELTPDDGTRAGSPPSTSGIPSAAARTPLAAPPPPDESTGPQRRKRFPAILFSIGVFVLTLVLMGVCSLLVVVVQAVVRKQFGLDIVVGEMSNLALGGVNLVAISVTCVVGALVVRRPWRELFPFRPFSGWLLVPMALTIVGSIILSSEADNLVRTFLPMPDFVEELFAELSGTGQDWPITVWLLVLVAPFTEELLMRGLVLQTLLRRHSIVTSLIVSALLFALLHGNPWQFVGPLSAGFLFGWWCVRTGSLWPGFFGHAMYNGITMATGHLDIEIRGFSVEQYDTPSFQPLWFDALGVVCLAAGLALTVLVLKRLYPRGAGVH